ncbi:60S ribosomal protein L31 [Candidatus Woesearchaeota archaeon]|nr:60S ribosomal protein L31 [Candidatus Woesearchaeota archaeon]
MERVYNVPLRREWLKAPKYQRGKKAVKALKEFLMKHMKSENVKIGKMANLEIWKHGIKNPPHHVQVKAVKDADGVVKAELVGFDYVEEKKIKKEKKGKVEELKEKFMGKEKAPAKKEEEKEIKETQLEKAVEPKKEVPRGKAPGTSKEEEKENENKPKTNSK